MESLADPEQGDPPCFSAWVLVLVLDEVPPVPHDFEQIEKSDQVDHSQFTENNKEMFCFNFPHQKSPVTESPTAERLNWIVLYKTLLQETVL